MLSPTVSVIMSVYNEERFLAEALESLLGQTFVSFEVVIVDDASTDATPEILETYRNKDNRIRVLRNEVNKERSFSRNRAVHAAKGEYVAVLDADDVCFPHRLETQVAFMREHPEVTVCGAFMAYHDAEGGWSGATDDAAIRARMLFVCPLAHPTVMLQRDIIISTGGYDEDMPPAEDYALWARLAESESVRFANIPEILLRYRIHPQLVRMEYWQKQRRCAELVHQRLLERLGIFPSREELDLHWLSTGYVTVSPR